MRDYCWLLWLVFIKSVDQLAKVLHSWSRLSSIFFFEIAFRQGQMIETWKITTFRLFGIDCAIMIYSTFYYSPSLLPLNFGCDNISSTCFFLLISWSKKNTYNILSIFYLLGKSSVYVRFFIRCNTRKYPKNLASNFRFYLVFMYLLLNKTW